MTLRDSWICCLVNTTLTLIVLCCASVSCFAQLDRGTISGIVTDPSGSAISGAKVTVTNTAMGTQNFTVTTGVGTYTIPDLPAGRLFRHSQRVRFQGVDPQRNHGFGRRDRDCQPATLCGASYSDGHCNGGCSSAPDR